MRFPCDTSTLVSLGSPPANQLDTPFKSLLANALNDLAQPDAPTPLRS